MDFNRVQVSPLEPKMEPAWMLENPVFMRASIYIDSAAWYRKRHE